MQTLKCLVRDSNNFINFSARSSIKYSSIERVRVSQNPFERVSSEYSEILESIRVFPSSCLKIEYSGIFEYLWVSYRIFWTKTNPYAKILHYLYEVDLFSLF